MMTATASAKSIRTFNGDMPRVQWAVVESTAGKMENILEMGARILAPTTAKEDGTYALYGAIEKENPNLLRLLEIYASDEAYRIHSTSPAFQQYRAERLPILAGLKILPVNGIVLEQKIRGVGPSIAQRIIDFREQNGNFKSIDEIKKVRGIGEKTFEKIKDSITVK